MADVRHALKKLPPLCAARHPTDGTPIVLKRGVRGYLPASPRLDVDAFNSCHGITLAQVEAMEIGSHFGWNVPGADLNPHAAEARR